MVAVTPQMAAAVRDCMAGTRETPRELARRMGVSGGLVWRLLAGETRRLRPRSYAILRRHVPALRAGREAAFERMGDRQGSMAK